EVSRARAPSPPLAEESRRGGAACSVLAVRAPSPPSPASGGGAATSVLASRVIALPHAAGRTPAIAPTLRLRASGNIELAARPVMGVSGSNDRAPPTRHALGLPLRAANPQVIH